MQTTTTTPVPREWLDGALASDRRLAALIAPLTDKMARRPTRLPGWSVGHLLTHLARNADGFSDVVEAAQRGGMVAPYPGGPAQREADIAAGADRPAAALIADLMAAQQRLARAWAATSEAVWTTGLGLRPNGPMTLADFVFLRWREVQLHLVDLGLAELGGPEWEDLDPAYVTVDLIGMIRGLAPRLPSGITVILAPGDRPSRAAGNGETRVIIRTTANRILAWLFGRGGDPSWPELSAWS